MIKIEERSQKITNVLNHLNHFFPKPKISIKIHQFLNIIKTVSNASSHQNQNF